MKISNETLTVLKNFAKINPNIEFKKGNVIKTVSTGKSLLAKATIKDNFTEDFCIEDLNQFLIIHDLNKDTDIDFDAHNVILKSGRIKYKYRKTEKSMILAAPDRDLDIPSIDVSFTLKEEDYAAIMKSASAMRSPNICVQSDGEKILLTNFDTKDDSVHTSSIEVADGNGKKFKAVFLTENLLMIPGSYDVQISSRGLTHFKNSQSNLEYWITLENKYSNFGE